MFTFSVTGDRTGSFKTVNFDQFKPKSGSIYPYLSVAPKVH